MRPEEAENRAGDGSVVGVVKGLDRLNRKVVDGRDNLQFLVEDGASSFECGDDPEGLCRRVEWQAGAVLWGMLHN